MKQSTWYTRTLAHSHTHTHTHARTHTHTHTYIHTHTHTFILSHTDTDTDAQTHKHTNHFRRWTHANILTTNITRTNVSFIFKNSSEVVSNKESSKSTDDTFWIGEKFSHSPETVGSVSHLRSGFKKSIVPTKTIFQFGLHAQGACNLHYPFNGCTRTTSSICTDTIDKNKSKYYLETENETHNRSTHRFIDSVTNNEIKDIDIKNEAALFHYQVFRSHNKVQSSANITKLNEYSEFYYPQVAAALRIRQLDLLIDIPSTKYRETSLASNWSTFKLIYQSRKKYGALIMP